MGNPTTVNRGSECFITATYKDQNGANYTPASSQWRVDDLTNQTQVTGWTVVTTPTSSDTVTITSAMNAMTVATDQIEKRQVTFKVTTPDGQTRYDTIVYDLVNLYGAV